MSFLGSPLSEAQNSIKRTCHRTPKRAFIVSERESRGKGASGALDSLVQMDLKSLRKLTTKELRQQFRSVFGIASLSTNRTHLFRRLAWRLQADRQEPLRERTLGRAFQLTADGYARLPLPKAFERLVQQRMECNPRDRRLPPFGATLERTYQGKRLAVTVLANGFEYNEKIYGSRSARLLIELPGRAGTDSSSSD